MLLLTRFAKTASSGRYWVGADEPANMGIYGNLVSRDKYRPRVFPESAGTPLVDIYFWILDSHIHLGIGLVVSICF